MGAAIRVYIIRLANMIMMQCNLGLGSIQYYCDTLIMNPMIIVPRKILSIVTQGTWYTYTINTVNIVR